MEAVVVAGRQVDDPLEQRGRAVPAVQKVPHVVAGRVQLILTVEAQKLVRNTRFIYLRLANSALFSHSRN